MIELIIIILIITWVIRKKQKDALNDGGKGAQQSQAAPTAARQERTVWQNTGSQYTATPAAGGMVGQQKPQHRKAKEEAIQAAKQDGNSTTAYLMEKAEADAKEHAREKFEEQKRLHESKGGLAVAERLYDGDPVPQGKRCIVCGYCGAENLVPLTIRTRYSCYFCREPL